MGRFDWVRERFLQTNVKGDVDGRGTTRGFKNCFDELYEYLHDEIENVKLPIDKYRKYKSEHGSHSR